MILEVAAGLLALVLFYLFGYIVSFYSLAVYVDPDEIREVFPDLKASQAKFLERITDDPRAFRRIAIVFNSFVAVAVTAIWLHLAEIVRLWIGVDRAAAYLPALAVGWLLHVLLVEFLPRRSSRESVNEKIPKRLLFIRVIWTFFNPVVSLYSGFFDRRSPEHSISEEEKEDLVERAIETLADDAGISEVIVEEDEKEMIGQIFQLDQTTVREIMVPRPDITAIERSMTFKEIRELVSRDGHSRYPVYRGTSDNIVGLIYVKDLFNRMPGPGERFITDDYLRQPFVVPETKIIGELLREFQLRQQHIAMVADEYGGVAGLVTLEDIIEEIFGEIRDEHDREEEQWVRLPDGRFRVSAALLVEKLQDYLDTDHEQDEYDTVGGLIYDLVGSVPHKDQLVRWHDIEFEVERVEGQRIMSVKVKRQGPQPRIQQD